MIILIEFNELCPGLLRRFMDEGQLPNFRRLHRSSMIFTTDAAEEPPHLEPWIQWPTVHSGLSYEEHGVFHLGDGRRLAEKCVAEVLSNAGVPVGVFGSMNINYGRLRGYVVPDPWDAEGVAHPEGLGPFYRFIARQVQESSRDEGGSKADAARFALFLARNGLRPATAAALAAQLMAERRDPGVKWRRAMLLDHLQYDVFRRLNRRFAVRFATFFGNSTAHFQHYHWRNMEPGRFAVPPSATDHPSLRDAIPEGYRSMDRLLGRFLADYPEAVLMLCTALSQQPWIETTKCTYRPHRFEDLLEFAGVPAAGLVVKPVMAEEFHLDCPDEATADRVERALVGLTLDGEPAMKVERAGAALFGGCRVHDGTAPERPVARADGAARRFGDLFYMVHSMRSGRHHPDGVLWVRTGSHRVVEQKVPLTVIAPTILAHYGVAPPARMRGAVLPIGVEPAAAPA